MRLPSTYNKLRKCPENTLWGYNNARKKVRKDTRNNTELPLDSTDESLMSVERTIHLDISDQVHTFCLASRIQGWSRWAADILVGLLSSLYPSPQLDRETVTGARNQWQCSSSS
jgi:hypothetical protein